MIFNLNDCLGNKDGDIWREIIHQIINQGIFRQNLALIVCCQLITEVVFSLHRNNHNHLPFRPSLYFLFCEYLSYSNIWLRYQCTPGGTDGWPSVVLLLAMKSTKQPQLAVKRKPMMAKIRKVYSHSKEYIQIVWRKIVHTF